MKHPQWESLDENVLIPCKVVHFKRTGVKYPTRGSSQIPSKMKTLIDELFSIKEALNIDVLTPCKDVHFEMRYEIPYRGLLQIPSKIKPPIDKPSTMGEALHIDMLTLCKNVRFERRCMKHPIGGLPAMSSKKKLSMDEPFTMEKPLIWTVSPPCKKVYNEKPNELNVHLEELVSENFLVYGPKRYGMCDFHLSKVNH